MFHGSAANPDNENRPGLSGFPPEVAPRSPGVDASGSGCPGLSGLSGFAGSMFHAGSEPDFKKESRGCSRPGDVPRIGQEPGQEKLSWFVRVPSGPGRRISGRNGLLGRLASANLVFTRLANTSVCPRQNSTPSRRTPSQHRRRRGRAFLPTGISRNHHARTRRGLQHLRTGPLSTLRDQTHPL